MQDIQSSISASHTTKRLLTSKHNEKEVTSSASGIPEHSFMTVIHEAGMGGDPKKNSSDTASHFDEVITNFVSKNVRRLCYRLCKANEGETKESKLPELVPEAVDAFAAVVMVDVSGYSKLTAALAERGPVGAELLSKTMKGYLDQIIEVIVSYGGDIIKFAGDAVIVYWKSETAVNMTDSSEDIERGELVYKAAHCCLTLLTKLGSYDINITDCATKTLRIHLGIGAGLITDVLVGGSPGRWEHFIAGDGVNQLSQVLDLAKAGELALSHQALKWLVWVVDIRTLNLGDYDKRCIILTGLAKAERRVPPPIEKEETFPMTSPQQLQDNMALYKFFMDRTALFKLQSDINQSNLFQLDSSLLELLNLTELRQITTIFIKIGSLQGVQRDELLQQSQDAIQVVQNALHRCDGSLRQFHVDDKGAVILCFFGLPPLAHENDSKLGINAGIEIRDKFLDMFEDFSMGITTGVVSFGGVGANGRAEYAVMGDAINMAARLMCHKEARRGILCDEKTINLCENDFHFENLGETTVKGKNTAIAIFRPLYATPEAEKNSRSKNVLQNSQVIGREAEKKALLDTINQMNEGNEVNILLFHAEGGQGLTTLANYAKAEAIKQGCHFCTGKAVQTEQNNSFFIFQSLVHDMINLLDMGSKNGQGQFKIPSTPEDKKDQKGDVQLKVELSDVAENNSSHTSSKQSLPDRKNSRRASMFKPAEENQDKFSNRRQSYTIPEAGIDGDEDELFSIRFRMVMEKLECGENQAALLQLVTQDHDDGSDAIAQAHLKLHARDLCNILTKMLNTLTEHNKIIIMITEAHWVDTLSWDLLLELAVACPKVGIFAFARPESAFENKDNRRIYRLIEQLPRTKSILLGGLTAEETNSLILATWFGSAITSVDQKIAETIYKRTDGNPFFIRSLVYALKESGQWRIAQDGALTTPDVNFDFDKLVLGYDNQSMVLAQFDRLNRNFQLFLKVASVLGQKFALDDVLFFLTGTAGASEQLDRQKYNQILNGLLATDKYGFLSKESGTGVDGVYFQFKSAIVRKCIYSMMVHNQRQQIHLLVAQYFESKMNEQNRHRYIVQIWDHYMNTSAVHKPKRILYTEMCANHFSEKESIGDSIKYFKQLLELTEDTKPGELKDITNLQIANWHRELGYALLLKEELDEAESHLITSLKIMGHVLPEPGYKFNWAFSKQERKRKQLDRIFFQDRPVPQEEDYTQSYVARKGASGYSLSNLVPSTSKDKKPDGTSQLQLDKAGEGKDSSANFLPKPAALSPAQQIIRDTRFSILNATHHALVTLAEVFLKKGNFQRHHYAIVLGLNLITEDSMQSHMCRLFALGALSLKLIAKGDVNFPAQYVDAATGYDQRNDIFTSLKLVTNGATLLFLAGQLEACQNKLEVVSYLSGMAGDLPARIFGLHLKCTLQTLSIPRETALTTARFLYTLSHQRESWIGKMWGCFHIIHHLLGDPAGEAELQQMSKEIVTLWNECPDKKNINLLPVELAKDTILAAIPFFGKGEPELLPAIEKFQLQIEKINFYDWQCFIGLVPLAIILLIATTREPIADTATIKCVEALCANINKALKSQKGLSLSGPFRRVFKGIKLIVRGKKKPAMKAWQKGNDDQSEDLYTQALLHSAIGSTGEDPDDSQGKSEDIVRDLHAKLKFKKIFPPN
ncbi:hypothetical protein HDV01_007018 [Terramyces sp. JEL0728]|nr:hypothetical protein HDV01_007018 [Terramyces sp. JEL0728]